LLVLLTTNSLAQFFQNMYVYTFQRILVQKALDTPFLYEGSLLERFAKLFFYTSPFLFSLIAYFLVRKVKVQLWIIPVYCIIFYLLGIRPTTDIIHLAPLLAFMSLSLALIVTTIRRQKTKILLLCFFVGMTLLGFYSAYNKGYYKWDYFLRDNTYFSQNPRINIFLTEMKAKEIDMLSEYIQSRTSPDEHIFVNYYAPLIYFLADRENVTRYDFISSNELPIAYQLDIRDQLEKKNIKTIVTHKSSINETSIVANYMRNNYHVGKMIGDWIVFVK